MDAKQFDGLLRSLTSDASRRGVLTVLTGGLFAALPFIPGDGDVQAKKKRKKKKKKPAPAPAATCTPNCGNRACGNDDCGGSCGRCDATQICQGGTCLCPAGTQACGGACIPEDACCPICTTGQSCLANGSCATVCDGQDDCADGCFCPVFVEGPRHCTALTASCEEIPQVCTSSAECPPGQHCQETGCGAGGSAENRCLSLCAAL